MARKVDPETVQLRGGGSLAFDNMARKWSRIRMPTLN
jgi:hypothetical protein